MSQFMTAIYIEGKINNHRIVAPPLGRLSVEFNTFCMKEVSNEKTKKILSMKIISMKILRMKIISMEENDFTFTTNLEFLPITFKQIAINQQGDGNVIW